MTTIAGLATARGFASGPVFVYRGDGQVPVPEYLVERDRVDDELMRLKRAVVETKRDLETLISILRQRTGRSDVRVFECHLMILDDEALKKETKGYIIRDRLNAEAAVRRTANGARRQFERMNDPYFRERVRDLDDIERRILKSLTGFSSGAHIELHTPSIIIADDLTPSETVQLPRELVLGFATNGGSTTSHVALLARALAIPAVTGLVDITSRVKPGEVVLLDGTNGAVTLNPDESTIRQFNDLVERQLELAEEATLGAPAGTLKSGGDIPIYANIHPGVPLAGIREQGARGIGLYRSEYLWFNREVEPTEDKVTEPTDEEDMEERDHTMIGVPIDINGLLSAADELLAAVDDLFTCLTSHCETVKITADPPKTIVDGKEEKVVPITIGFDGKTEDGSMPYTLLKKQLEYLR